MASMSPVCKRSGPFSSCHRAIRAKPCSLGKIVEAPKTGKTKGIPPRIGFRPSNTDLLLTNNCSCKENSQQISWIDDPRILNYFFTSRLSISSCLTYILTEKLLQTSNFARFFGFYALRDVLSDFQTLWFTISNLMFFMWRWWLFSNVQILLRNAFNKL